MSERERERVRFVLLCLLFVCSCVLEKKKMREKVRGCGFYRIEIESRLRFVAVFLFFLVLKKRGCNYFSYLSTLNLMTCRNVIGLDF